MGRGDRFCPDCGRPVESGPGGKRLVTIGREEDNDIVLADDRVSRYHARVFINADGMTIEDLGSANGVKVDGVKVTRARLRPGADVCFGSYRFDTHKLQPFLQARIGQPRGPGPTRQWTPWLLSGAACVLVLVAVAMGVRSQGREPRGSSATREYLVLTESWDGARLTRQRVSAEIISLNPGEFSFRFSGADLQLPSGPITFSLGQGHPEVTTRTDPEKPIHKASIYHALARALVAHQPAGQSRVNVPVQVPRGAGLLRLGSLDLQLKTERITALGKQWERVTVHSERGTLSSLVGNGTSPTRATGAFIWDSARTTLAVADMLVEQDHGSTRAWTRFSVLLADADGTARTLLKDLKGRVRPPRTRRGSAVGKLAMAELGWVTRSAALVSAVEAEGAQNPVFLALLALAHIADAAYTFGANMGYDLAMMLRDPSHEFNPFDGDERSILEQYVYGTASGVLVRLAAQLGLISVDQVDGYALWGGKILHFAGGIVSGLSMKTVISAVAAGQGAHLAHQLWGMSAHVAGTAQQSLVALGRLAYYGSRLTAQALQASELLDRATDGYELWTTRPWSSSGPEQDGQPGGRACTNTCPEAGRRECVSGGFRVCGDLNEDSCLEWGPPSSCGSGKKCVNGACIGSGPMRFTLTWDTGADIDIHVDTPCGETIWYKNKKACGGQLDVDDRCGHHQGAPGGPENIYWEDESARSGDYVVYVHYYDECGGGSGPTRYQVQIRHGDTVTSRSGVLQPGSGVQAEKVKIYQFRR